MKNICENNITIWEYLVNKNVKEIEYDFFKNYSDDDLFYKFSINRIKILAYKTLSVLVSYESICKY